MRLICPNCGAQYEVDARVIPEKGRDVQCSNCGHTWYQRGEKTTERVVAPPPYPEPASEADETIAPEAEADQTADESPGSEPQQEPAQPEPDAETASEPEVEQAPERDSEQTSEQAEPEETEAVDAAPEEATVADAETVNPEPSLEPEPFEDDIVEDVAEDGLEAAVIRQRRELNESVTDILQEEAAREVAERQSEQVGLETQTEFGLEESQSQEEIRERMERMRSFDDDHGEAVAVAATSANATRRDLLPDIEEINSTLEASEAGELIDETADGPNQRKGGFRRGFTFILFIVALGFLLYLFAPRLAEAVPSLAPILKSYVDFVNNLMVWFDGVLQSAVKRLTNLVGRVGGSG